MEYIAHIEEERKQRLIDHLDGTAKLAGKFAESFGKYEWGYCIGMLHDLGKYSKEFQHKIQFNTNDRVDHSTAGMRLCNEKGGYYSILQYAIAGHHSGLMDYYKLEERYRKSICDYQAYRQEVEIPQIKSDPFESCKTQNPHFSMGISDCRQSPRLFAEDFSVLKRLKVSIFKTFQSLFGIIKVSKRRYCSMMTQETEKVRKQMQMVCIDDLVPRNHLLRLIDKAIDWTFIYDLVRDTYSDGMGRPSIDPVTLIKIPLIQYLYGIKSMRQTIKEIEVNMAYRWFLGLELYDPVPHFSTFGKNYTRRFKDTDLFEQIFQRILEECYRFKLVDSTEIFVDATHVKARANNRKMQKRIAKQEALFYADMLRQDINADREAHGKKPLKDKDDNNKPGSGGNDKFEDYTDDVPSDEKTIKCSTTDPESGWFRKGEHKHVFAYGIETACDKNGWIIDFTVNPGNEHDSRTFKGLYDKLADIGMKYCIVDAGYKTPAIAKLLLDDGIKPVFPYKRPMTKDGFFRKSEYVYDEYNDAYICPGNHFLHYSTTNRDGYREYKSCGQICEKCEYLSQCTESKNHVKVVTRHVWEDYMETCEDIRHTEGMKELYSHRKETIERIFGTAKENHGFRYTQLYGKARMTMKVALTFACMNLKKLAKCKQEWGLRMA